MTTTLNEAALLQSRGTSAPFLHRLVASVLTRPVRAGTLVDVGCGTGELWPSVREDFTRYIGIDGHVFRDASAGGGRFIRANLDCGIPLADGIADAVVAIETIEHLENPWQFVRELARVAASGGCVVVTTPNQLSALSKATLLLKHRFNAFQDAAYPAHRTALLEIDLARMFAESGLEGRLVYTGRGRIAGTASHYPKALAKLLPRALSDNVLMVATKP